MPRLILAGQTSLVGRRCSEQRFFFRPCAKINNIIRYCLAWGAKEYGIEIHGYCVMSNHWHAIVTDRHGRLPKFMQEVDKLIAKCLNVHYDRSENLFSSDGYQPCELLDAETILRKLVYVAANPVAAQQVRRARHWQGALSLPGDRKFWAVRPLLFFDPDGNMPEELELELTRPPGFEDLSDAEFDALFLEQLQIEEVRLQDKYQGKFAGRKAATRLDPFSSPRKRAPRRGLRPTVASKNPALRAQAIRQRQAFRAAYREALEAWVGGDTSAVFPWGTYWHKWHSPARVAPPPEPH